MPKNLLVLDVRPNNSVVVDSKSNNSAVLDIKPKGVLQAKLPIEVYQDTFFVKGLVIGPGFFNFLTYNGFRL